MTDARLLKKDWRMSHLYTIQDLDEQLVTFIRNIAQEDYRMNASNRNITLKSRQLGFTTEASIEMLDNALFIPNSASLLIAHEKKAAEKLFSKKIDLPFRNIPEAIRELWAVDASNANTLKLDQGNGNFSSIEVATSGRSGTYGHVHISEFGKICRFYPKKAYEIITGTFPSVPMSGRLDIESTAEGAKGDFYSMFWDAWNRQGSRNWRKGDEKLPTEFSAFFYNWQWDKKEISKIQIIDELPSEFLKYQIRHNLTDREISYYYLKWIGLGGKEKTWKVMKQEYPTTPEEAFSVSGNAFFDSDKINELAVKTPEKVGEYNIYHPYNPSHVYALGADIGEGMGRNPSTIVVIDLTMSFTEPKVVVVATYRSAKIPPDLFAYKIRDLGNIYGTCLVAPERNNHGFTTIMKLKEIYPKKRIYMEVKTDKYTDEKTEKLGWHSNAHTRPKMLYDLNSLILENLLEISSDEIKSELLNFDSESVEEDNSDMDMVTHFDFVIALGIAYQMRMVVKKSFGLQQPVYGGVNSYFNEMGQIQTPIENQLNQYNQTALLW